MARTTRRGKTERDHACDKRVGTGRFKLRKLKSKKRKPKGLIMAISRNTMPDAGNNEVFLTPDEGAKLVVGSYLAGTFHRTPLFKGSPGVGKSSLAKQAADRLKEVYPDFQYIEINPTMPADEVGGIPEFVREEGHATRTDYALPAWFPTAAENPDWKGIINLDDALQGDKMMQQTLANLILARNLRGHALPKGAMIVATGNRVQDRAGVTRTLTHFADRMCHFNIKADAPSWIEHYAVPKGIDQRVIAYIMRDHAKLDMFNPDAEKCPTPRTWEATSNWLKYIDSLPEAQREKVAQAVLSGELGQGEAIKFWAFCKLWGKLPEVADILKDPANHTIDYELDIQYALVVAISNAVDDTTLAAALEYIDRIGIDFTVLGLKVMMARNPKLGDNQAYTDWAMKHAATLRPAA